MTSPGANALKGRSAFLDTYHERPLLSLDRKCRRSSLSELQGAGAHRAPEGNSSYTEGQDLQTGVQSTLKKPHGSGFSDVRPGRADLTPHGAKLTDRRALTGDSGYNELASAAGVGLTVFLVG